MGAASYLYMTTISYQSPVFGRAPHHHPSDTKSILAQHTTQIQSAQKSDSPVRKYRDRPVSLPVSLAVVVRILRRHSAHPHHNFTFACIN